jgi:hypothetical protein
MDWFTEIEVVVAGEGKSIKHPKKYFSPPSLFTQLVKRTKEEVFREPSSY